MSETGRIESNVEITEDSADLREGRLRTVYLRGSPSRHHKRLVPDF